MAAFIAQNMAPIMFASLVIFLLLGYPVAFSLAACGLVYFIVGVELAPLSSGAISLSWPLLQSLPERIYGVMNNEVLLAIPFFTLMGLVLERSGMAEDLLDTIGQLFGTIRGGLAYAVVFVGALLAATTGVVAASVISMGLISLPIMLRYGYDRRLASGVIAASGTLAQIIPPSLVLIVMADQLGRSVGDMYEGAFVPGIVLACLYASWVFICATFFPKSAPGLPADAVGFHEPSRTFSSGLARVSGLGVGVLAGYLVFRLSGGKPASLLPPADILSLDGGGWALGTLIPLLILGLLAFAGLRRIFDGDDDRGLFSLTLLVGISAVIGVQAMQGTTFKGADFVILCMAVAITVAFAIALVNWLLWKATGLRFLSLLAQQVTFVMVPPLFLIFLVLGTIFIGLATPTEGGAMGASGAILLAIFKRFLDGNPKRFSFELLRSAIEATAKLSAFVVFILVGARIFSLTFYGVNGHIWVEHLLTSLPGGQVGFLVFVNIMVFLLAFFLDFFELAFIIIPLLGPAAEKLGIDLIWFGVMLGVNMQTSFMHPPFGFALFYLRSVAPRESYIDKITGQRTQPVLTSDIYWGAIPFVVIQCIMVGLVIAFPGMVMHYKTPPPTATETNGALPGGGIPGLPGVPSIPGVPGISGLPPFNPGGAPAPGISGIPGLGAPPGLPPGLTIGAPAGLAPPPAPPAAAPSGTPVTTPPVVDFTQPPSNPALRPPSK